MKQKIKLIHAILKSFGINLITFFYAIKGIPFYLYDFMRFIKQRGKDPIFNKWRMFPVLSEKFSESGTMKGHYFHQDLYVASKIFINNPVRHVDIGSRTDGFVAHVAVFREIEIIDIREQKSLVNNVIFRQADLMKLPENMINYCDSISALHSIEHFGLGRYGDPIDYNGYLKAIDNISKMLKQNGKFYFSVPIGHQRIEFNAHRIFSVQYLLTLLSDKFYLNSFSYVNDSGDFFENVELVNSEVEADFGCYFGCGIFEFTKK
jgi:SAM-dependent methyltransferase